MSIKLMSMVWDNFQRGGSEKLALLALADWANDEGGSLHPSIAALAKKICASECQARRILHHFIEEGLLAVVGNENGGKPGSTRRYQLNVQMLQAPLTACTGASRTGRADASRTAITDATPSADATPSTHARRRVAPVHETASTHATQTTIEPSIEPPEVRTKGKAPSAHKRKAAEVTMEVYLSNCKANGVDAISESDAVFDYADRIGMPIDFLRLCWLEFVARHIETGKRQASWPQAFRNCVRGNWYHLWWQGKDGWELTSAGKQAQMAHGFRSAA